MESQTSSDSGNHLLESALDQAFSNPPSPHLPISTLLDTASSESKGSENQDVSTAELVDVSTASLATTNLEDSWKAEYEAQVQSWRAQSAEAREKAEKERLRWESIRAIEKEETAKRKVAGIIGEPPEFIVHPVGEPSNIASADATYSNPVLSETGSGLLTTSSARVEPNADRTLSRQDTATEESQKWEDVPSLTSSFPSMSFPEHIETPPHDRRVASQPTPVSLTSAIFDSSLSRRTRLAAFCSSLAVNLLLPFVNGVMLGFGEIFAKNVVMGWLGWNLKPGSVATTVGIRGSSR